MTITLSVSELNAARTGVKCVNTDYNQTSHIFVILPTHPVLLWSVLCMVRKSVLFRVLVMSFPDPAGPLGGGRKGGGGGIGEKGEKV